MNIDLSRAGWGGATHCKGVRKKCITFIFDTAAVTRHKLLPIVYAKVKVTFFWGGGGGWGDRLFDVTHIISFMMMCSGGYQ